MRLNILLVGLILIAGVLPAQSLETELIQISLEFRIALRLVREGQSESNLELIGLQSELIDWQNKEERWLNDENELRNELQDSKQQAGKLRQDLRSASELSSGLTESFSAYKKETVKSLGRSKFWNKIFIIGLMAETVIILVK